MANIERKRMGPLSALIFSSRWLQLPLYLGLIVAMGIYVWQFWKEMLHLFEVVASKGINETEIMLGVLDLGDPRIETAETVAARIRAGLKYVAAENLIPAPDCGMKYLPREVAFGKLKALADGARIVRAELG